jgi:hypothetical protein
MKRISPFFISLFLMLPAAAQDSIRYGVHLKKNKKAIVIAGGWIGLTTNNDTVKFFGEKDLSYAIYETTKDSFLLRKPEKHIDTVVRTGEYASIPRVRADFRYVKSFRKEKKRYASIILIESYTYKSFAYKDLTSIQYPPDAANTTGCIFCILVPVYNVYYILRMRRRSVPKNFNLPGWELVVVNKADDQ